MSLLTPPSEFLPIPQRREYVVTLVVDIRTDGHSPEEAIGVAAALTTQALGEGGGRVDEVKYLQVKEA